MSELKLTNHFYLYEFFSPEIITNLSELVSKLEIVREYIGKPIYINHPGLGTNYRGFRTSRENLLIGGADFSYHMSMQAVDISWDNFEFDMGYYQFFKKYFNGIIWYPLHVHLDIRKGAPYYSLAGTYK